MHRVIASSSHASIAELERLRRSGMQVDAVDECGLTCLFMAAAGGEREVCEWLVAHGADVDARNPEDGRSPLHAACAAGHVAVAAQLLSVATGEAPARAPARPSGPWRVAPARPAPAAAPRPHWRAPLRYVRNAVRALAF